MSYNLSGAIQGGSITLVKAGLTGLSGAASTFSTNALTWANQSKVFTRTAFAAAASPVNDAASSLAVAANPLTGAAYRPLVAQQPPVGLTQVYVGSACCFVYGLDQLGNIRVAQGRVVQYMDVTPLSTTVPLPTFADWFTPFAYVVVKLVSATATNWTFGTGLWNAPGLIIDPIFDVMTVPPLDPLSA